MKQRIAFIDLAKGICISLVVLWHVLREQSDGYDFFQILFFFRMPLYFILSGLFFKTYDGFFPFIKKKTNKLLIPFLFTYFVLGIPSILFQDRWNGNSTSLYSFCEENGRLNLGLVPSSWFLICLFFVNIYFYSVFVVSKRNVKVISFFCIVLGILGYYINVLGLYLSLWLDTSLTVMPFFLFGYLIRNFSNILYSEIKKIYYIFFVISLTTLLLIYYIIEHRHLSSLNFIENVFGVTIVSLYLGGISGSFCILVIAKILKYVPVFSYIGRYSIVVLLTHQPLLFVIRNVYYQLGISQEGFLNNFIIFVIIMLLSLPVIKFCIRFLPYFYAQKDVWK
jgi:fucose 4-O-acetylase-like acetyltransferase